MARALDRRTRPNSPSKTLGIREVYPTRAAMALRGAEPVASRDTGSPNNFDDLALNCFQCGFTIDDRTAESQCPLCLSNNFDGRS